MIVPLVKIKIPHLDPLGVRTNSILITISSHDTRNKGWTVIETLVVIFFLVDRVIKKINPLGLSFVQYNVLINVTYYIYNTRSLCRGRRWPWSYGSWIYNYLCNQCLSPLMLWVRISIRARCTALCDKVCQWLATGRRFSLGPPVSFANKTDRHDITEKLLNVALRHHKP
jgi:hypothetical protein